MKKTSLIIGSMGLFSLGAFLLFAAFIPMPAPTIIHQPLSIEKFLE